jgi:hypothetical protein
MAVVGGIVSHAASGSSTLSPSGTRGKPVRKFFFRFFLVTAVLSVAASAQTAVDDQLHDSGGKAVAGANVVLQRAEGSVAQQVTGDAEGKFRFAAVEAGAYTLKADAPGFYQASYDFVARARQPLSLTMDLQRQEAVQQSVEVKAEYLTVDPEKTGSSYTFTQQDLEKLPDPLVDTTSDLVNNLIPGASDSHDNFLAVRGTEFSLHEFINGVSFLDNTQPQFSPGTSPQIFETVDLMTGGFTPEYGNRFGGVLDITTRSGADLGGHGDINFRGATVDNYDLNADYGGQAGRLGYFFFVDGFTSAAFSIRLSRMNSSISARAHGPQSSWTGGREIRTASSFC